MKSTSTSLAAPVQPVGRDPEPPWRALPVLLGGAFLAVLDFFIVAVALPPIGHDLGGGAAVEWLVAGYATSFAALLFAAAQIGDRFGRRRVFGIGVAAFVIASLGCAMAPTLGVLIAARVLQGAASALIMPTMLSLVGAHFPGRHGVRAMAAFGIVQGVAAAGGQLLGGALIAADVAGIGWRAIFAINVPIGIALIAMLAIVPESRPGTRSRVDVVGLTLLSATIVALVLPLVQGSQGSWPWWSWVVLGTVPLLLVATARQQRSLGRRGGSPMFPAFLLTTPALRGGLIVQLVFWCGQASFFVIEALFVQRGLGLTPVEAGVLFGVLAVAYVAASFATPALVARWGRDVVTVGSVTLLVGYALTAAGALGGALTMIPGLILIGLGQGSALTPLAGIVLGSASPQTAGVVSGALATMQQVGASLGVAVVGLVYFAALPLGGTTAFAVAIGALGAITVAVLVLTRLLPRRTEA